MGMNTVSIICSGYGKTAQRLIIKIEDLFFNFLNGGIAFQMLRSYYTNAHYKLVQTQENFGRYLPSLSLFYSKLFVGLKHIKCWY